MDMMEVLPGLTHALSSFSLPDVALPSVLLASLVLYAFYYLASAQRPIVTHGDHAFTARVAARLDRLRARYWPTLWCVNPHADLVWLALREQMGYRLALRNEEVTLPDGETVMLQWSEPPNAPADAPVVLLLHGIGGSVKGVAEFVQSAEKRQWRCVTFLRRGHGRPLTKPVFNLLGDAADLRYVISHIKADIAHRFHHDVPLFMLGISAGSGLLGRYLGEEQDRSPVMAGALISPGFDASLALARIKPMYNSLLLKKLKKHFVDNNKHLLREHEKFDEVNSAKTLVEFVAAAAHFSELHPTMHAHVNHPLKPSPTDWAGDGVSDYPDHMRDYFFRTNPMVTIKKLKVPVISISAENDPICVKENRPEGLQAELPTAIDVLTRVGSHCSFRQGLSGTSSWAYDLACDYFQAVLEESKTSPELYMQFRTRE